MFYLSHIKDYIVCFLFLFIINTNIVLDSSFHFVLMFFASSSFFKCVFVKFHFSTTLFVGCQIHFAKFYFLFCTMVVVLVKETQLVVAIDDLDFGIKDVAFEAKALNRHGTFDRITNKSMEDSVYAFAL